MADGFVFDIKRRKKGAGWGSGGVQFLPINNFDMVDVEIRIIGLRRNGQLKSSQVKPSIFYILTPKSDFFFAFYVLSFIAKNNRTAVRKAFCLIAISLSCSSGFKGRSV